MFSWNTVSLGHLGHDGHNFFLSNECGHNFKLLKLCGYLHTIFSSDVIFNDIAEAPLWKNKTALCVQCPATWFIQWKMDPSNSKTIKFSINQRLFMIFFWMFPVKGWSRRLFHIVPHRKFDRIGGTSSATFLNFNYVAPREICVDRDCFNRPIAKWDLEQIFDVESSRAVP